MSQYFYNPFPDNNSMIPDVSDVAEKNKRRRAEKKEIRLISLTMGCAIVLYLIVQILFGTVLSVFNLYDFYYDSVPFYYGCNIILSVLSVALPFGLMALVNKKRYKNTLIPNKRVGFINGAAWTFFGVLACVVSQITVAMISSFVMNVFGYELTQGDVKDVNPDSVFTCILQFIAMAVVPAISEEFAMRCCSLQLYKKFGKGFSVFAVSIVFGLLHGNIVQFIFAFLVGLILAFVTVKTDNIVPAVMIHFINNSMSVIQTIVKTYSTDDAADLVTLIFYVLFTVLGIASVIYLAVKKQFKCRAKNEEGEDKVLISNGAKFVSFLFPWMIVPFIILILLTATTIKKVQL